MEIEFHYIRRITGLLAANSKSETTKKVRETGRFQIPEFDDQDAPVAYRELGQDGKVLAETRWFNGSHWHVTESVPPTDGTGMVVGIPDYDLMYGDLVKSGDNISHGGAIHGFVDRDKKWFRVVSDDAEAAYEKAVKHFTENTAVIGGKFAFRVLEPSLQFSVHDLSGTPPFQAHLTTTPRATVEHRRWYHKYGLSLHEHAEGVDALVAAAGVSDPVSRPRPVEGLEILIPEAFSATLVEPATRKVIEDGLSLANQCLSEFDLKSKVAFVVMRDAISRDGRLIVDSSTALEKFGEFGDILREAKMKTNHLQNKLLLYIDCDLRVTGERLDTMRSLDNDYGATKPVHPAP
ncbi:hypothetical protein OIU34_23300 [Pararhizobium sp. BT-229]|uniref:hypothetical protein n=1 Tax=Pararhizobium sp. BT-229 TaxID=2986923 RepID=UPI0021F6FDF6|nr:hypothetical protein [Pararhizobium sp. BT-229]MCV9964823.1 hypothetical protein [Pararhizobium sp. BT-229]